MLQGFVAVVFFFLILLTYIYIQSNHTVFTLVLTVSNCIHKNDRRYVCIFAVVFDRLYSRQLHAANNFAKMLSVSM